MEQLGGRARQNTELTAERQFLLEVVGEALGQHAAAERKILRRKFAKRLRELKSELAKTQATVSKLRSLLTTDRNASVDVPASPL